MFDDVVYWTQAIPMVGSSLFSGQNLKNGDYFPASIDFGYALLDVVTIGMASKYRVAVSGVSKAAKGVSKGTNVVYQGFNKAGAVKYVGITERQAAVRFGEHLSSGTAKSLLRYEVVPGATNLSRTGARVWEQTLINQYGLPKNGGLLLNRINSISPKYWWQYGIK